MLLSLVVLTACKEKLLYLGKIKLCQGVIKHQCCYHHHLRVPNPDCVRPVENLPGNRKNIFNKKSRERKRWIEEFATTIKSRVGVGRGRMATVGIDNQCIRPADIFNTHHSNANIPLHHSSKTEQRLQNFNTLRLAVDKCSDSDTDIFDTQAKC